MKRCTGGRNEEVKTGSVIVRQKGGMWSSEGGWVYANSGSNPPPPPKKNSIKFPKTFFTDSDCLPHPSRTGQTEEVSSLSFSYCFVVFNSELGRVVKMLREVIFLKKKTGGNIQCCVLTNVSGEKCCLKKARWQYGDMLQATLTVCVCVCDSMTVCCVHVDEQAGFFSGVEITVYRINTYDNEVLESSGPCAKTSMKMKVIMQS